MGDREIDMVVEIEGALDKIQFRTLTKDQMRKLETIYDKVMSLNRCTEKAGVL